MARSRRKMAKPRGARADWVFRSDLHDDAGALIDPFGTYEHASGTLAAGHANSIALVLYDSHNYMSNVVAMGGNVLSVAQPRAARAEGGRAKIRAVRGSLCLIPSTWALGSVFTFGARIGVFEQDPVSGFPLAPLAYNMWGNAAAFNQNVTKPAVWANSRTWDWELRRYEAFNTGAGPVRFNYRVGFPSRKSLRPHECYAIYMESEGGSVTLAVQSWLRTLVVDEG